jgi:hypothetical protein
MPRDLIGGGIVIDEKSGGITFNSFGGLAFTVRKSTAGKYEVAFTKPLAKAPPVMVGTTQRLVSAVVAGRTRQEGFDVETWTRSFATTQNAGYPVAQDYGGFWFLVFDSPRVVARP